PQVFGQRSNSAFGLDDVRGQFDNVPALSDPMTELVVVGTVRDERLEAADLAQSLAGRRHRGAKSEPYPLELPGREDARGEIGGDAERLELARDSAVAGAGVQARDRANAGIVKWRDHRSQVIRSHSNIAVADHQDVVTRLAREAAKFVDLAARSKGRCADQ